MRTRAASPLGLLAVTALLAAACGSANPPAVAGSTPSASPTNVAASPSPTSTSTVSLALVTLRGSNSLVVRDITDINHPKTVTSLGPISQGMFVSATEVSYFDYDAHSLIRMPVAGFPKTTVVNSDNFMGYMDWSPDARSAIYLVDTGSGMALHEVGPTGDQVLDKSLPTMPAVGCESEFCALGETADVRLSYSPDGARISLVESIAYVQVFRLWTTDGKLLVTNGSDARSMPAWSADALYFQGASGVEVWRGGTISPFLPGVAWIRPKASPAGGQLVYETRDAQHAARTFVVDIGTREVRQLKAARFSPVFLTSRFIWYQGQRPCVASDHCPSGWSAVSSGKTYIYDLQAGTETESIITSVSDVWPHAA